MFGRPALAALPIDRGARAMAERGRLLPARGRMARRFDRLAAALVPETGVQAETPADTEGAAVP